MFYMTVDELKALMPLVFTPGELLSIGWSDYTPEDLSAILERSEGFIDGLRYKGCYVEHYQLHAFPRELNTGYVVNEKDERVQKALCCIVYDLLKGLSTDSTRADLIRQGVKSISTGGVSESYGSISDLKEVSMNYVKYLGFCLFKKVL